MSIVQSVRWGDRGVVIIDQRRLPAERVERELGTLEEVCEAIRTLAVRGAPAIGITGAMGLVAALRPEGSSSREEYLQSVRENAATIRATRPTAVNLPWALARMVRVAEGATGVPAEIHERLRAEATAILEEDRAMCQAIGEHGLSLIKPGARIATHCNTGALATGGIGTALAPIYLAHERGLRPEVFADETRPLLQGSRLTAWELRQANIPVTILADAAAASLMRERQIDLVIVGADRIAANGDVANKVGTYALAIAARHHGVPFYVAAPSSTVDPDTATGADIHIEQRHADEVRRTGDTATAPADVDVYNPAFDVTPADLISAIITDRGVHRPPYAFSS
ncbi:MAG TPA: S-methyl-5-thioribose-1-phosphate isomerase [Gemmatimonadaceae bacterium]|nr:S-methyl-5-thioribose-1-phosphate isomerase [Gemmatimonadaceae bacterium]